MPTKKIKILDCTIRDGGFTNGWNYSEEYVKKLMVNCDNCNLYAFELGYLINDKYLKDGMGVWRNVPFKLIKKLRSDVDFKSKISIMIDIWRYDFTKLDPSSETGIDIIRLCIYPKDLNNYEFVYQLLSKLGYKVSINIIAASHLNDEHINLISESLEKYSNYINYLYVADSFGSLNVETTEILIQKLKRISDKHNLLLGYHAHDNGGVALANTLKAIEVGADIVDGTYEGLGRGGGNLILENFILYNYFHNKNSLDINSFLQFLMVFYQNRINKLKEIKELICGFMNVHPYRLREFNPNNNNLDYVFKELNKLDSEEKQIY